MIKRSIVAVIAFSVTVAACADSPLLPRPDAARDSRAADSRVPDSGLDARDAGVDAAAPDAPTPGGPTPDGGGADRGPDGAAADSADATADAGQSPDLPDAAPGPEAPAPDTQVDSGSEGGLIAALDAAATDVAFSCQGISRDDACMGYCQGITTVCTGVNAQYPSIEACRDGLRGTYHGLRNAG